MPLKAYKNEIVVQIETIDHMIKTRKFKSLEGARKFAVRAVGPTPEVGTGYAVAPDGVATVATRGILVEDLFYPEGVK